MQVDKTQVHLPVEVPLSTLPAGSGFVFGNKVYWMPGAAPTNGDNAIGVNFDAPGVESLPVTTLVIQVDLALTVTDHA